MTEANIWTALYCFVFYLFLFVTNYNKGVIKYADNRLTSSYKVFMLLCIGFFIVTHCMKGDFFHLMEKVKEYDFIYGTYNYGEAVYPIIAEFVNKNYFSFRIIVWGASLVLYLLTSKRMGLHPYNAAAILIITHAITFSYARATASMALYFFGASFLCKPCKRRLLGYLFGGAMICLSYFFHRSALVMILMTTMLLIPMNKWTILFMSAALFLFTAVFKDYFELLAYSSEIDDIMSRKLVNYSDRTLNTGIAAKLLSLFDYLSFLIPFFYCVKKIYFDRKTTAISSNIYRLCNITIGIVFVSFSFFLQGASFVTFYYRILYMSMIPLTIIVAYLWNNRVLSKKQFLFCLLPGIIYHFSQYMYSIYLANSGIS